MLYAVRWERKVNPFINSVRLLGVPSNRNKITSWRLLLQSALYVINIAEKYEGKLLTEEPPKRN